MYFLYVLYRNTNMHGKVSSEHSEMEQDIAYNATIT